MQDNDTALRKEQTPEELHPLLIFMLKESICEHTKGKDGVYLHIWFGSGQIKDYVNLLPASFIRVDFEITEPLSKFGGVSAYQGVKQRFLSKPLKAELELSHDQEHGMEAKLWVDSLIVGGA